MTDWSLILYICLTELVYHYTSVIWPSLCPCTIINPILLLIIPPLSVLVVFICHWFVCHTCEFSAKFLMSNSSDWPQIWWMHIPFLMRLARPDLLLARLLVKQFWSVSAEFHSFPGFWLAKQFVGIFRQTADWMELRFSVWTHFLNLHAWLTFAQALLNSRHSLAFELLISFCPFADKPLIRLSSNVVGELIVVLPSWGLDRHPCLIFKEMYLKRLSAEWQQFCSGFNVWSNFAVTHQRIVCI